MRRQKSNKELFVNNSLQTIRNIFDDQRAEEQKTQEQNQKKIKDKTLKLCKQFIHKLRVNSIKREFKGNMNLFQQKKQELQLYKNSLKGLVISNFFKYLISFLYVLGVLPLYFICSWQGLIDQYLSSDTPGSITIQIIKITGTCFVGIYFFVQSIQIEIIKGKKRENLKDILIVNLKSFQYYVIGSCFISAIVTCVLYDQRIPALVTLALASLNFIIVNRNLNYFNQTFFTSLKSRLVFRLFKLFFFNMLFIHFVVCLLLITSYINGQGQGWVSSNRLNENKQWYITYFSAYYWAITIMTTVGFGDFLPMTWQQAFCVAFIEIITIMVLGWAIGEVSTIFTSFQEQDQMIQNNITLFRRISNGGTQTSPDISDHIQGHARIYLKIKNKLQFEQRKQLINNLPKNLRDEYLTSTNIQTLGSIRLFRLFTRNTIINLASKIDGSLFSPNEFIINQEQQISRIIILDRGLIGLAYKRLSSVNNTVIQQINITNKDKPILLNTNIYERGTEIPFKVLSLSYSLCNILSLQAFEKIISQSPLDKQYYWNSIHGHFSQQIWPYSCTQCKKENHSLFSCPKLHYVPYREVLIMKWLKRTNKQSRSQKQKRKKLVQFKNSEGKSSLLNPFQLRREYFERLERKLQLNKKKQTILKLKSQKKINDISSQKELSLDKLVSGVDEINVPQQEFLKIKFKERRVKMNQIIDHCFNYHACGQHIQFENDLNIDKAYNYAEYFPNFNSNKLKKSSFEILKNRNQLQRQMKTQIRQQLYHRFSSQETKLS